MRDLLSEIGIDSFHNLAGVHDIDSRTGRTMIKREVSEILYIKGRFSGSSETAPPVHLLAAAALVSELSLSSRNLLVDLLFRLLAPGEPNICRDCAGGDVSRLNSHLLCTDCASGPCMNYIRNS
jgi:hypothetical protein